MLKFFVSDMDGTLLGENHLISAETAKAVKTLQKNSDIEFLIATGRDYLSARPLLDLHEIECDLITLNGAATYNKDGKVTNTFAIDKEFVDEATSYLTELGVVFLLMGDNIYFTPDADGYIASMSSYIDVIEERFLEKDVKITSHTDLIKDLNEYERLNKPDILKIFISSQDYNVLDEIRNKFKDYSEIFLTSSGDYNIEINAKGVHKAAAIRNHVEEKGFTMENVLAIGDSFNDLTMLEEAGFSYAMENARDEIKEAAQNIAPSNKEHGVAQVIYKKLGK